MKIVLLVAFAIVSTLVHAGSLQDCADQIGLKANTQKKTLTEIVYAPNKDGSPTKEVLAVRVYSPTGMTEIELGTNGCKSSQNPNVWERIGGAIQKGPMGNGSMENPFAHQQALAKACGGLNPGLDMMLSPGNVNPFTNAPSEPKATK